MPEWFYENAIIATLQDGRVIAKGKNRILGTNMFSQGGCEVINVRVPGLRMIDYVLHLQLNLEPLTCGYPIYTPLNKKITGNVVGITLMGSGQITAIGSTLNVEVIAVGPP